MTRGAAIWVLLLLLVSGSAGGAWAATLDIPLNRTNGWQFLKYRTIPQNVFHSTPEGLEIDITNSAAPAVFPLTKEAFIVQLHARGRISGSLKVPAAKQGQKGFDDYTMRVGLVEAGPRTMRWPERVTSPDWVKHLFALAPQGTGISKIHFFNVGTDANQIGHSRIHPSSNLMEETIVAVPDSDGRFSFTQRFAKPMHVVAFWIASDGDDTRSSYSVTLGKLQLETSKDERGSKINSDEIQSGIQR